MPEVQAGFDGSPVTRTTIAQLASAAARYRTSGKLLEAAQTYARIAQASSHDWVARYNAAAMFLEAGELVEATRLAEQSIEAHATPSGYTLCGHVLALRGEMPRARVAYENALRLAPRDFDANWGIFEVAQLLDDNAAALAAQRVALEGRSLVTIPARTAPARTTILELCIAGTFQANIPLDFILDRDRVTVHKLYVGQHAIPALPPYDLVFNTIADAPNAVAALNAARAFIATQDKPVLNAPQIVPLTSRDAIARRFAKSATVAVAATAQASRATVDAVRPPFPILIRPLDSHAGNDLARIEDAAALHAYFDALPKIDDFYVSAFIDYRKADGYFRKYRIVFVDGIAYPVHLAISPRWMIHYYNAPMAEHAWMRDEEHAFMRRMDAVFDGVRAEGLREIAAALPLDYFGIDCSIGPDGRVLLFEASTAMIVHMRDPVDLYPYKAQYVPRVLRALEQLFDRRIERGTPA